MKDIGQYEWDSDKAAKNFVKHRVRFSDATSVFEDPRALTIDDDHPNEGRQITIGLDALGRLVVVVYTWRDDGIRLISARKATEKETGCYEN